MKKQKTKDGRFAGAQRLAVGDTFPDLGPLETEESTEKEQKTVDLLVGRHATVGGWRCIPVGSLTLPHAFFL